MCVEHSGENYIMRSFMICTPHPNIFRVMGGACSFYGGGERLIQGFGGDT